MKQQSVVLDTSVILKWISKEKEDHLAQAEELLVAIVQGKIQAVTIDFLLLELANVLLKAKKLPPERIEIAVKLVINLDIKMIAVSPQLIYASTVLAQKYNITLYDSIYLALAQERGTKVLTADKAVAKISPLTLYLGDYS